MDNTERWVLTHDMQTLKITFPFGMKSWLHENLKPIATRDGGTRFVGVVSNWREVLDKANREMDRRGKGELISAELVTAGGKTLVPHVFAA